MSAKVIQFPRSPRLPKLRWWRRALHAAGRLLHRHQKSPAACWYDHEFYTREEG